MAEPTPVYEVAHTSALDPDRRAEARALLEVVFEGDFAEVDWEHSLGGVHVLALVEGQVVGHAAVVQRRLLVGGRALRAGYVEGVGVHPHWQRHGIGGGLMERVEGIIRGAYVIGALGSSDEALALYSGRGWVPWTGPLSALTPAGPVPTPEEAGAVFVLEVDPLDPAGELTCDWRDGDVW